MNFFTSEKIIFLIISYLQLGKYTYCYDTSEHILYIMSGQT